MDDLETLLTHLNGREGLLRILQGFKPREPGVLAARLSGWIAQYAAEPRTEKEREELWWRREYPRSQLPGLGSIAEPLVHATRWADEVLRAVDLAPRHLTAAKSTAELLRLEGGADPPGFAARLTTYVDAIGAIHSPRDLVTAVNCLKAVPIQVLAEAPRSAWTPPNDDLVDSLPSPPEAVAKATVFVDGQLWTGVQILRAGEIHEMRLLVAVSEWPPEAQALRISHVTTLPASSYEIHELVLARPAKRSPAELELKGHARFFAAHASNAGTSTLRVRAAFQMRQGAPVPIPVIGHRELEFRVSDAHQASALRDRPVVGEHLQSILDRIDGDVPGVSREHRDDFLVALEAVLAFQTASLMEGAFKGEHHVPEARFHAEARKFLRAKLGPKEVREGERLGGGAVDLHVRSVTIELKVERKGGSVEALARKYTAQPTQYSSAEGSQLGIVLVLDLAEKRYPPGDLRNYTWFGTVPVHGFDTQAQFPSAMALVVIPGNLNNPSHYS